MNDFPREYLGLTGTKFGCGLAQCLSCAGIADNPEGTSETSPTCVVPAASFFGKPSARSRATPLMANSPR
jgi:aerobic-type carbon monoxide dehydrogenase small subunit (CoxS/CutS family)